MKKLPTYELKINPEAGEFVQALALVKEPAIESDFMAFAKEQKNMTFKTDDSKMELLGAAMIPDMRIYRRDEDGTEYNVFFTAQTIREIAQNFFLKGFQLNLNLEHTAESARSFVFQSYLVDSSMGMSSPKGLNLVDGSWVVGVKVLDPQVWQDIKDGKQSGFSIEGLFESVQPANEDEAFEANFLAELKKLNDFLKSGK